jgi:hypothetical protein
MQQIVDKANAGMEKQQNILFSPLLHSLLSSQILIELTSAQKSIAICGYIKV